jgi:hypothetical protein
MIWGMIEKTPPSWRRLPRLLLGGALVLLMTHSLYSAADAQGLLYCGAGLLSFLPSPPQDLDGFIDALDSLSRENVDYTHKLATRPLPPGPAPSRLSREQELELMGLFDALPPYLASVHLSTIPTTPPHTPQKGDLLCQTLQANSIVVFTGQNTPEAEKRLYSADRCLFLSYGKRSGETQYGDVTYNFDIDKLVRGGHYPWLAEHSATRYLATFRLGYTPTHLGNIIDMWGDDGNVLTDEERKFYARALYLYPDFLRYAKFNFITHVRLLAPSRQQKIYQHLHTITERATFYNEIARLSHSYGFLGFPAEVHVDFELPLAALADTVREQGKVVLAGISIDSETNKAIEQLCPGEVARYRDKIEVRN